eukprot:8833-Eustigmatos_ZCMA.PRE.1
MSAGVQPSILTAKPAISSPTVPPSPQCLVSNAASTASRALASREGTSTTASRPNPRPGCRSIVCS